MGAFENVKDDERLAPDVYHQGPDTLQISRSKLHQKIRAKVLQRMKEKLGDELGVILLQGGGPFHIHSTDMEGCFRQEGYFHYIGHSILFMPRLPPEHAVWMGPIAGTEAVRQKYAVDAVHYVDEMAKVLKQLEAPALHLLCGINSDSGRPALEASFEGIDSFSVEREALFPIMADCRAVKTPEEIEVMRYANQVASSAHVEVMRKCRPGLMEYALEAVFLKDCYLLGGCRHAPYTPICASGPNGAVLHYGHAAAANNRQIQDKDMMLMDMGCEYYAYDSDITCSFPANGRFTDNQRGVYESVLAAHQAVLEAMRPGVKWPDMHLLAERALLGGLKAAGFVRGDVGEMLDKRLGAVFMPHGLGHLLGIDTHDVGGYLAGLPPRSTLPGLRSLRTARVLEAGMVITVEPGCYFNEFTMRPALQDPALAHLLVSERIEALMGTGGVRLEDDVVVTPDGCESLTNVPRAVAEVEAVMAGGEWPDTALSEQMSA
ncbi:hypothetical protein WJX81_008524 [Elliptochloris bilobata]|uniref:Xaa-Pro dipeptidase n=1 Tax=Elliptochloris bilobata TaxID=381761 RepID=A0AAW1S0S1_9CHLO